MTYINMDFQGLQETISRLISGEEIEVGTLLFENDFETFRNCDDVLTLLIHLGYFIWNEEEKTALEQAQAEKFSQDHNIERTTTKHNIHSL